MFEIVLAIVLCTPNLSQCDEHHPATWQATSVQEKATDVETCEAQRVFYEEQEGTLKAACFVLQRE